MTRAPLYLCISLALALTGCAALETVARDLGDSTAETLEEVAARPESLGGGILGAAILIGGGIAARFVAKTARRFAEKAAEDTIGRVSADPKDPRIPTPAREVTE